MTDKPDNTNEEHVIPVHAALHPNSMHEVGGDDFADEEEGLNSDDLATIDGELTPNDIFGLDPLDVLTLEELADYLKVSPAAARRAMKEQNLPGRNIGGEFRFLRDAVANWLRGQEAPALEQQKAREDYSKPKQDYSKPKQEEGERFSRPPQRPYQSEQSGGGEYRPRQRFPEGGQQQYGNQYGRRGGQPEVGGQYGGGQYGNGGQYGSGGQQSGGEQYRGGSESTGSGTSYSRPPRRPFRPADGGGQEGYGGGGGGGGTGGYQGGATGGTRFGAGGYAGGGQRYGGGPKRKNKRQVFDNERGKRLDRRKEGDASEGQE